MSSSTTPPDTGRKVHTNRDQTGLEELFNALSHGLGLLLAIASLPILVYSAAQKGRPRPSSAPVCSLARPSCCI